MPLPESPGRRAVIVRQARRIHLIPVRRRGTARRGQREIQIHAHPLHPYWNVRAAAVPPHTTLEYPRHSASIEQRRSLLPHLCLQSAALPCAYTSKRRTPQSVAYSSLSAPYASLTAAKASDSLVRIQRRPCASARAIPAAPTPAQGAPITHHDNANGRPPSAQQHPIQTRNAIRPHTHQHRIHHASAAYAP